MMNLPGHTRLTGRFLTKILKIPSSLVKVWAMCPTDFKTPEFRDPTVRRSTIIFDFLKKLLLIVYLLPPPLFNLKTNYFFISNIMATRSHFLRELRRFWHVRYMWTRVGGHVSVNVMLRTPRRIARPKTENKKKMKNDPQLSVKLFERENLISSTTALLTHEKNMKWGRSGARCVQRLLWFEAWHIINN